MNSILWFQTPEANKPNYMSKNGNQIDVSSSMFDINFEYISNVNEQTLDNPTPWIGYVNGNIFFKGTIKSKDNSGRSMCFIYLVEDVTMQQYALTLNSDFTSAGIELSATSKKIFDEFSRNKLNIALPFVVTIIFLIILIILIQK